MQVSRILYNNSAVLSGNNVSYIKCVLRRAFQSFEITLNSVKYKGNSKTVKALVMQRNECDMLFERNVAEFYETKPFLIQQHNQKHDNTQFELLFSIQKFIKLQVLKTIAASNPSMWHKLRRYEFSYLHYY